MTLAALLLPMIPEQVMLIRLLDFARRTSKKWFFLALYLPTLPNGRSGSISRRGKQTSSLTLINLDNSVR